MTRTIAFALYPGLTPLDLVGPLQVLSVLAQFDPTYEVVVVGATKDPVGSDTPLRLAASHTFDEVAQPYAIVVPGGTEGTFAALADERLIGWARQAGASAEVIGSVCTGSLVLGTAGLLEGRKATTHWSSLHVLARLGATPVTERIVEDGPVITAAGVSAGIDWALHLVGKLAGEERARQVQLMIEYDPQPPLGPIDWSQVDRTSFAPWVDTMIATTLKDHPDLVARLTA